MSSILEEIRAEVNSLSPEEIKARVIELMTRLGRTSAAVPAPDADFVISESEYMHSEPTMRAFRGTWRALLEDLNGVTDENRHELWRDDEGNLLEMKDMTDKQLIELFADANGDGQPYTMVWSVAEGKKVLG